LIAELARAIGPDQFRNTLNGHFFDLKDIDSSERRKVIAAAKPVVISANAAMISALRRRPEDIHTITPDSLKS